MITTILGLLTGLLGTAFTAYTDGKKVKVELELEALRGKNALDLANAEIAKIETMEKAKVTSMVAVAEAGSFDKSLESDKATYVQEGTSEQVKNALGYIDVIRGAIRPWLTITCMVFFIYLTGVALYNTSASQIAALFPLLIDSAIYFATTFSTWWFGIRSVGKK